MEKLLMALQLQICSTQSTFEVLLPFKLLIDHEKRLDERNC